MTGNAQIRLRHAGQKEASVTLEATYAEFFPTMAGYAEFFSGDGSVEFFSVSRETKFVRSKEFLTAGPNQAIQESLKRREKELHHGLERTRNRPDKQRVCRPAPQ